jgi:aryl-alcohol dehydrogenase-like predicted oxidoreductase
MQRRPFKPFGHVSALTLGGGGLGQVWGDTTREEAVATARLAIDSGITHFDMAPMYGKGEAERVIGEALKGIDKSSLQFTTKYRLGNVPAEQIYDKLNASLTRSLATMDIERVDLFFLHSQLIEDSYQLPLYNEMRDRLATPRSLFQEAVIPAFERLQEEGKIGGWGFALGQQSALEAVIASEKPPTAVQCVINPLNSAGNIAYVSGDFDCRAILRACRAHDVPALAIRAVQAGALTSAMDRDLPADDADRLDFDRAAGFRALAAEWGQSPARLAHRYALSIDDIGSVILGVKNREELRECLLAESDPRLSADEIEAIDRSCAG